MDANFLKPQAWNTDPFWAHYHGVGNKAEVYISNQCPCSLGQAHPNTFAAFWGNEAEESNQNLKVFQGLQPYRPETGGPAPDSSVLSVCTTRGSRWRAKHLGSHRPPRRRGSAWPQPGLGDRKHVYTHALALARSGSRSHKNFNKFLGDFMLQEHIQGYLSNFLKIQCAFFMNFETPSTVLG